MNRKKQHINHLLSRWLKGDVNRQEEAELEAAAQEDEFLAGALEGYRRQAADDHTSRLAGLRQQLAKEPASRRRGLPMWRVAAAIAVLLVAAAVLLRWPGGRSASDLAMTNEAAPQTEKSLSSEVETSATTGEESFAEAEEAPGTLPASSPPAPPEPPAVQRAPGDPSSSEPGAGLDDQLAAKEKARPDVFAQDEVLVLDGVPLEEEAPPLGASPAPVMVQADEPQVDLPVSSSPSPAQSPVAYTSRDRMAVSNSGVPVAREGFRLVQGVVKDAEGYPLIGATVLQPGTTNGTVTDVDGRFTLSVDEAAQALQVSYTGYETTLANVADELDIALDENEATLDEVVVTGYSQARREELTEEDSALRPFARPENGLAAYKEYIDQQAALLNVRGKVRLAFKVDADGTIRDVEVIRSTNPGLNTKAIELLQNGPKWEIVIGEAPVETIYVVRFR